MDVNMFKEFKPQAYNFIKSDYGVDINHDDGDSDFSLPTVDDIFNGKLKSFANTLSGSGDQAGTSKDSCFHNSIMTNMKSLFNELSKDLKEQIDRKKTS